MLKFFTQTQPFQLGFPLRFQLLLLFGAQFRKFQLLLFEFLLQPYTMLLKFFCFLLEFADFLLAFEETQGRRSGFPDSCSDFRKPRTVC